MSGLETALVILVSLWTIIFAIIAAAMLMIFFSIKRGLKKVNDIIDKTEAVADQVNLPSKAVLLAIMAFLSKNSVDGIKNLVTTFLDTSKKK